MVTNKTWVGVRVYRRQLGCRTADGLVMSRVGKDAEHLNNTVSYLDLVGICRTPHPKK